MKYKSQFAAQTLSVMLLSLLAACSKQEAAPVPVEPELSTLGVTVEYETLGDLPEESVIYLKLEDVSNGPENAFPLAQAEASDLGESPYQAELAYDPRLVRPSASYRLTATLKHEGKDLGGVASISDPFNVDPLVLGIFQQAVGAGSSYQTLSLQGPLWVLKSLGGLDVELFDPRQRPNIEVSADSETYAGFTGCNRYTGGYTLDGTKVTFGAAAATRMYCEETAELEQQFLVVLNNTRRWGMDGSELVFRNDQQEEIARFEAFVLEATE